METQTLYALLSLQPEIVARLNAAAFDRAQAEPLIAQLMDEKTAARAYETLKELLAPDPGSIKMLWCQLEGARRDAERYAAQGISREIFVDTMKCFPRFIRECGEKNHGALFFDRGFWSWRQVAMTLFRVGTLEYEFQSHNGEPVLSMHIPSDADLSDAAVDASLAAADALLAACYPAYQAKHFVCDSWLLSPTLERLLPASSRILAFQRRFERISVNDTRNACIEWLFKLDEEPVDYAVLPEHTTLQRRAKAHLLAGGKIGSAFGVLKR